MSGSTFYGRHVIVRMCGGRCFIVPPASFRAALAIFATTGPALAWVGKRSDSRRLASELLVGRGEVSGEATTLGVPFEDVAS